MIESRCGILCSQCHYREEVGCEGCTNIDKPFWGDSCPVKDCCEGRGHEHCGLCDEFPCKLLTGFAYNVEQGDNGKRIEACRGWAGRTPNEISPLNIGHFIQSVAGQNADDLRGHFNQDAVIFWHDSNEQFTVDEYIRANCEYPGNWNGEIQRVIKTDDGVVVLTKIFSDDYTIATFVTSIIKLQNGKISRLDEYYADCDGEIPEWRKQMNIGKPIS
jgi:hypothetical protein